MADPQNEELDEKLLSISELLDILVSDPNNQEMRESIEKIISKNYEIKPLIRYDKSINALSSSNSREIVKEQAEPARTCARIIIERLSDFDNINTIKDVEIIVNHQIGTTKNLMTIHSFKNH